MNSQKWPVCVSACLCFLSQLRGHDMGINYVLHKCPPTAHFGGDYHYESIKSSPLLIIDQSINNSLTTVQSSHKLMMFAKFTAFLYNRYSINSADVSTKYFTKIFPLHGTHKQEVIHNSPILWSSTCGDCFIIPDKPTIVE